MNKHLSVMQAYIKLREGLSNLYSADEATAIAHEYIESLTGLKKMDRLLAKDDLLNEVQYTTFHKDFERMIIGEPLQHITGYQWFASYKFIVNNHVLIPRPETEELIQWLVEECKIKTAISILDIGTGSGCIPIAIKKKLPTANVTSCDISEEAITIAKLNAQNMNTSIQFIQLDFLKEVHWKDLPNVDVLISNPPYIPVSEKENLDKNVRDFEPATALFVADDDPFIFYRKIAVFGLQKLNPNGAIYCEIHQNFAEETMAVFNQAGYSNIELRKDIYGNDRMLKVFL